MKVTPKERRARLFKHGKPTIRNSVLDDAKWEWVHCEYEQWDGLSETMSRERWMSLTLDRLAAFDHVLIIEDRNAQFASGYGPVCIVCVMNYGGWVIEPHSRWFAWATPRNKLRGTVEFLRLLRNNRSVGVVHLKCNEADSRWFKRISKRYNPLYFVGRIPHGRPDGDEYLFYLRGSKHEQSVRRGEEVRQRRAASPDRENAPGVPDAADLGRVERRHGR